MSDRRSSDRDPPIEVHERSMLPVPCYGCHPPHDDPLDPFSDDDSNNDDDTADIEAALEKHVFDPARVVVLPEGLE
jgi:hypothetical protein